MTVNPPCIRREAFVADLNTRIEASERILRRYLDDVSEDGLSVSLPGLPLALREEERCNLLKPLRGKLHAGVTDAQAMDRTIETLQNVRKAVFWLSTQSRDGAGGSATALGFDSCRVAKGQVLAMLEEALFAYGYFPAETPIGPYTMAEEQP